MNLKIIFRGILKEKFNFLLTLIGLSVGFSGFLILQLLIDIELNYDTFHSDYDNIYRVISKVQSTEGDQRIALSDGMLKNHLHEAYTSVNNVTHFIPIYYGINVISKGESFEEEKGLYVDENFNDVFDFTIISGNSKSMFSDVNTIALTKTLAIKYFGEVNVIGQALAIDDGFGTREMTVTGVYDDVPENSSIQFDFLVSNGTYPFWDKLLNRTNKNYFFTYLQFDKKISEEDKNFIESNLDERNQSLNNKEDAFTRKYSLQPIRETHLDTFIEYDISNKTEPKQIYVLWFISLSIILITSINFINTNTILSSSKIKLLGMIKVFGHKNPFSKILVFDSFIKTMLTLSISLLAIGVLNKHIFEQVFHFKLYLTSIYPIVICAIFFIAIGLIGGLIPANYLRKKKISDIVKGKILIT